MNFIRFAIPYINSFYIDFVFRFYITMRNLYMHQRLFKLIEPFTY